jgi:hypothetical protein
MAGVRSSLLSRQIVLLGLEAVSVIFTIVCCIASACAGRRTPGGGDKTGMGLNNNNFDFDML